jgi:hypothetical protein
MHPGGVPEAQRLSDVRGLAAWLWQSRRGLWHPAGVHGRFERPRSGGRSLSPQPTAGYSLATLRVERGGWPLAQATQVLETKLPKLESGDLGENWPEWLITRILLREAKGTVEGK